MGRVRLGGGGYAALWFNRNLLLQGGISVLYLNSFYSNTAPLTETASTRDASGGIFGIAFPLKMTIHFRP
jgi:hypothetical protein